ncbi:MAG: tetratricopeptide repeat protein [Candidatus Electronema sp. VV]
MAEGRLDYDKALRQYKKAVTLEENNPDYLYAVGEMAWIMGEYKQAEDWCVRLLKIREQGKDDAKLGIALNNLAALYYGQGRYLEAEPLCKRSLEIKGKVLGKDHPDVAIVLNNLENLYKSQGKYKEANPMYQQAIAIMKKKFPGGHPHLDRFQKNYDDLKRKMAEQK